MASYKGGLGSRRRLKNGLRYGRDAERRNPSKIITYKISDMCVEEQQRISSIVPPVEPDTVFVIYRKDTDSL